MPVFPSVRLVRGAATALALVSVAALARADDAAIQAAITKELQNPALAHGYAGVYVRSLSDQRVIFSQLADREFVPASNMKLLVSSCVVDTLPADFHYTTPVMRDGSLQNGVLTGSLYLKGSGDPTMDYPDLQKLAQAVKAAGITRVEGDIVGDGSIFDNQRLGAGWEWDDLPYYYSAEIDGLTVDRGCAYVRITPGEVGKPATVRLDPDAGYLLVRNTTMTVSDSEDQTWGVDRPMGTNIINVTGTIRRGNKGDLTAVTVEEPAVYTAFLFRKYLQDLGVTVTGAARRGETPSDAVMVASHDSGNLAAILKLLNKPSDNLIAEHLLKTLGVIKKGQGTAAAGAEVERAYLKKIGADPDTVTIEDGSGLSRRDFLTPIVIDRILSYMWTHPNRDAFINSLPVAGVDGTLRNRMKGAPTEGKVLGKTGTLASVRSLSGYVTTKDGETLDYSILVNLYTGQRIDVDNVQNHICAILAGSQK